MSLLVGAILDNAARVEPPRRRRDARRRFDHLREVDAAGHRVARALLARGVRGGDRVAWWGDTALDAIPLFTALARIGAVVRAAEPRASGSKERGPSSSSCGHASYHDANHTATVAELASRLDVDHVGS